MDNIITVTEAGSKKISSILQNEAEDVFLRIFIKSGGCSGYSYGFKLDSHKLEDDYEVNDSNVRILIDSKSFNLIKGSQIDYVEHLMGGGFNIINPNATSACGCGESFRVDGRNIHSEGTGC